jgi:hypothetical protein
MSRLAFGLPYFLFGLGSALNTGEHVIWSINLIQNCPNLCRTVCAILIIPRRRILPDVVVEEPNISRFDASDYGGPLREDGMSSPAAHAPSPRARTTATGGSLWRQDTLGNALPGARRDRETALPDGPLRKGRKRGGLAFVYET